MYCGREHGGKCGFEQCKGKLNFGGTKGADAYIYRVPSDTTTSAFIHDYVLGRRDSYLSLLYLLASFYLFFYHFLASFYLFLYHLHDLFSSHYHEWHASVQSLEGKKTVVSQPAYFSISIYFANVTPHYMQSSFHSPTATLLLSTY